MKLNKEYKPKWYVRLLIYILVTLGLIKKARLVFLNDTVRFYTSLNRSVLDCAFGKTKCLYRTDEGRACAIGRWISDRLYNENIEGATIIKAKVLDVMPKFILALGYNSEFFEIVQTLHDTSIYWCETGLSQYGSNKWIDIKVTYCK